MPIDEAYIIERQGRRMALYPGLLAEAHRKGLREIETELIQIPSPENGEVAIVTATVRTEDGKFSGLGDASPENVGRNIAPHLIRMAETRAKARAMRDAVNVAEAVAEDDSSPGSTPHPPSPARQKRPSQVSEDMDARDELREIIFAEWGDKGIERFERDHGSLDDLSEQYAREWLAQITESLESRARKG